MRRLLHLERDAGRACRLGLESHAEARDSAQEPVAAREVVCEVCPRTFRRESDKKRH